MLRIIVACLSFTAVCLIVTFAALWTARDPEPAAAGACTVDVAELHHVVDRIAYARSIHQDWIDNPRWYDEIGVNTPEWDRAWVEDYDRTLAVIAALYWRCGS